MFERIAAAAFLAASVAVAVYGRVFPEMLPFSLALLAIAALQVAALAWPRVAPFASFVATASAALALAAVLLTLLAGTIGGSFHIDPKTQPVIWALAAVAASGLLLFLSRRRG